MYIFLTIITIYQKYISLVNKVINFRPGLFVLAKDPMYGLSHTVAAILQTTKILVDKTQMLFWI